MFLRLLEVVVALIVVIFVVTQLVVPLIRGHRTLPMFHKRWQLERDLVQARDRKVDERLKSEIAKLRKGLWPGIDTQLAERLIWTCSAFPCCSSAHAMRQLKNAARRDRSPKKAINRAVQNLDRSMERFHAKNPRFRAERDTAAR